MTVAATLADIAAPTAEPAPGINLSRAPASARPPSVPAIAVNAPLTIEPRKALLVSRPNARLMPARIVI